MQRLLTTLLILGLGSCGPAPLPAQPPVARPGDPGLVFDESRYDPRFPEMREYARAGVEGGIPPRDATPLVATLAPVAGDDDFGDDLQAAIDAAAAAGGGVVLLGDGTYPLRSAVEMRSGVILRGSSRAGTRLESYLRYRGNSSANKTFTIRFDDVTDAGLEDLTLRFRVDHNGQPVYPLDRDWAFDYWAPYQYRSQNFTNERIYFDRADYANPARQETNRAWVPATDLYVDFVWLEGSTNNCWVDNCALLDSGSNGIVARPGTRHLTLRDNLIDGAFQKGPNGNGYGLNVSGKYILMTGNTVRRVRHWAIQVGAQYTVSYANRSETDVNFHQRDAGSNLVENNAIHVPHWHLWTCFQRGASFHDDPGPDNMFFANDCIQRSEGVLYANLDTVYTFAVDRVVPLPDRAAAPAHGTLYALREVIGLSINDGGPTGPEIADAPAMSVCGNPGALRLHVPAARVSRRLSVYTADGRHVLTDHLPAFVDYRATLAGRLPASGAYLLVLAGGRRPVVRWVVAVR